jgi:regulator of replication initiation timing
MATIHGQLAELHAEMSRLLQNIDIFKAENDRLKTEIAALRASFTESDNAAVGTQS